MVLEEHFETTATLLKDEAPKTCEAIAKILPLEGTLLHAMASGNEVLVELPDHALRIEPENWIYNFIPGDVGFWDSHWGEGAYLKDITTRVAEVVFIYGRHARLRNLALHETAANLFATIDKKLPEFAEICKRTRTVGPPRIRIENE